MRKPLSSTAEQGERLVVCVEATPRRGLLSAAPATPCDSMSCSFFLMRLEVVARGPLGPGFNGVLANEQSNCALTQGAQGHPPVQRTLRNEHTSLHAWSGTTRTIDEACDIPSSCLAHLETVPLRKAPKIFRVGHR